MSEKSVRLLDAGMGKDLKMRGVEIPGTIWSANALLVAPEAVTSVHLENIAAGADVITTNTYGIIRADLRKVDIEHRFRELNLLAAELARDAASTSQRHVSVAGSLPPLNGSYRPDHVRPFAEIEPQYREQAAILAPLVDLFICETMSHTTEARAAAQGACATRKPVIVSFTLDDEQQATLRSGEALEEAVAALAEYPLAGIAVNCCLPERIGEAVVVLAATDHDIIGAYANAFTRVPADWLLDGDKETDGSLDLRDDLTPALYGSFAREWINAGANLIGGCCGTVAAHTGSLREVIDSLAEPG